LGRHSQDVLDTAMVLQLGEPCPAILKDLDRIAASWPCWRTSTGTTPMLGRTLPAAGDAAGARQKIAGWASDIGARHGSPGRELRRDPIVQFGGRLGSLSALGDKAEPVMTVLASPRLALPPAPWFTQRVRVAALAQDAALVVRRLAKAARDISLMMQIEVGRGREPSGPGAAAPRPCRTKRNPIGRRPGAGRRANARRCWPHHRGGDGAGA